MPATGVYPQKGIHYKLTLEIEVLHNYKKHF